jgi:hypothetical protein
MARHPPRARRRRASWYRGNIDPSASGNGAPDLSNADSLGERVSIFSWGPVKVFTASSGGGTITSFPLEIDVLPKANTDNLDAIRFVVIQLYDSVGTLLGQFTEPFPDRKYQTAGTPSSSNNGVSIRRVFFLSDVGFAAYGFSPFNFNGYARVIIHNAYGPSVGRDYGQAPNTSAVWAHTAAIGTPPASAGGGGSNYCPAPEARILLEDGSTIAAGDLRDGKRVSGFNETALGVPVVGTVRYAAPERAMMRYLLTLADGRQMRFSKGHQLYSVTRSAWLAVQLMRPGEEIYGQATCIVASVAEDGPGPVMGFNVEGTHTYFSDGVLSHNAKASIP